MNKHYSPSITEAHTPEDGGWTTYEGSPVLLISIPAFKDLVHMENKGYSYAWLWDESSNGHIFCFKMNNGMERAILFVEQYAGKLLKEPEAQEVFHFALTASELAEIDDDTKILWFPGIELKSEPLR